MMNHNWLELHQIAGQLSLAADELRERIERGVAVPATHPLEQRLREWAAAIELVLLHDRND